MNRRPLCQIIIGFVLGIALCLLEDKIFLFIAVILFLAMTAEFFYKKLPGKWAVRGILFWGMFLFGFGAGKWESIRLSAYEPYLTERQTVTCQGKIYQKEVKNNQTVISLKECYFQINSTTYSCNHILVYFDSFEYPIGKTIIVEGMLIPFSEARNEGNFDEYSYYHSQKFDFKVTEAKVCGVYGNENLYAEKLYEWKEKWKEVYQSCMTRNAGVLTGMVLGDKSILDGESKQMYQKSGLGHLLCVSGLHLSVVGMTLYRFLRKRGKSYLLSGILCGGLVFSFAVMSGFGVSAKRAVFMFCLMLFGKWIGRTYDSITALSLAGFLLLMDNPFFITNTGCLFSFCAVLGVVVVGDSLLKAVEPKHKITENILVSLGIQLMTLPLVCSFYYEIPVYSVLINLLLLPFMGCVLFFGIAGAAAGTVNLTFGRVILFLPEMILNGYEKVCSFFLKFPKSSWITGSISRERLMLYYIVVVLFVVILQKWKAKPAIFLETLISVTLLLYPKPKRMEIDILDVGQGDGIYLCSEEGISMFIDGGSSDVKGVGTYRILPFLKEKGVGEISYWFVTHTDTDHISGMLEVMESGYRIDNIVLAEQIYQDEAYEELAEQIKENQINIIFFNQGEKLQMKESSMLCLFPGADYPVMEANARSLVLLYETSGFRGIFTGDISSQEEEWILEHVNLPEVSLYKAAHHGSKYSNSEEFLEQLSPEISVISCGENNSYGHPGEEAVKHMEENSGDIEMTMEGGQIKIWKENGRICVQKYINPLEEESYPMLK